MSLRNWSRLVPLAGAVLVAAGTASAADLNVKIGVMGDMSGTYADITGPGSVLAAQMAVEDFDPTSKGMNVQIVSADHQNKPDVGSNIARQWYDSDGVDMIVDVPTSSVALAVSQITREKNKLFLGSGPATSALTGEACSPNTIQWTYDTWELAHGTGSAVVAEGGDTWFFLTADYAFGHALEKDVSNVVKASGGNVLGAVRHPFPATDFSSFLLQAQGSGAKVIGLANAGGDTINSIKQASEFGITQAGQKLAGLLVFITDIDALGLQTAQGLVLTSAFYWDLNEGTRAWSKRFAERHDGKMPSMIQAGVYSATQAYLEAVEAAGTTDAKAVRAKMGEMTFEDPLFGKTTVQPNGRAIHDAYLVEVKKPEESKQRWDYYKVVRKIPAEKAFRPVSESGCKSLVQ
jgi:branched-chain amino acid transport system substrate-binding protein